MGKAIEVAVIDPKTGNPVYDEDGELVTQTVDAETGNPAKRKAAKKKTKRKAAKKKDAAPAGGPEDGGKE